MTTTSGRIFFFFFFLGSLEIKMASGGGQISVPLAVGVDRGHPQWLDLSIYLSFFFFFFLPEKSPKRVVGGGICSLEVGGSV
jgi:hypothetical protein